MHDGWVPIDTPLNYLSTTVTAKDAWGNCQHAAITWMPTLIENDAMGNVGQAWLAWSESNPPLRAEREPTGHIDFVENLVRLDGEITSPIQVKNREDLAPGCYYVYGSNSEAYSAHSSTRTA